ncbi:MULTISPECIES: hypothetical protein [Oleiagrimonas]|uniref:Uncharacterized protein n=1 Tax=Oleiagrimonas citrea TaxID=1665687 RepID=A0A846ZNJ8_9GAMM|nr:MULTISPECIES: hypothetical protein [Oleiagrimonas]NKZ39158.1 hypothetical protein [Oleiagrimonas citrea]RAP57759.1 hypothetical protein BTJ49_07685 [Oleiagrimonas sp. MCCC 1A03011]
MEAAGLQPGIDTLDRIVDAESTLVVLRTDQPEVLVEQFRQITRRSGQSAYVWYHDGGLHSLREGGVRVPGCRRVGDTLRYVLQSMHFGIYLMIGVQGPLDRAEQTLLRQLERRRSEQVRRVVLLTNDDALIESVDGLATVIGGAVAGARPRLRDGRWVV